MKTKPFLLATAGSTVDGRMIDDKMIEEMATSYDPKTYGARLNIEHIRGISPDKPFCAYGDVLELSTGEVDVNFNGKTEKRKALYGAFEVTEDAKLLNEKQQKVYPSIEIEPNFGGKGFAYLMGCALTDSPAAIATERMQFNRSLPGTITVSAEQAALLEFADDSKAAEATTGLLKGLNDIVDKFTAKFSAEKPEEKPKMENEGTFDMSAFGDMFKDFATTLETSLSNQAQTTKDDIATLSGKFTALETKVNGTVDPTHLNRPSSNGSGDRTKTDC